MKTSLASATMAFLLLITTGVKGAGNAELIQWEYTTYVQHLLPNQESQIKKDLDQLGRDGWELVSVVWCEINPGGSPSGKAVCYFKRQKKPKGQGPVESAE
jgi:hypothetical protein